MIGKAYISVFRFYDAKAKKMSFKNRPVLIVGKADDKDYIILPISRVTNQHNLDSNYDVPIDPVDVPLMNLTQRSYIRTHKQAVVNEGQLTRQIVDFRKEYLDIYVDVISKMKDFQEALVRKAL